jgi:histidinol-phosphate phosphatase family protein
VLLDRDGTIIVEKNYLSDPGEAILEQGALEGLRMLVEAGATLAVVSNQSGVGRGYFSMEAVDAVNARISEQLAGAGIAVAGWYVCPHRPDDGCSCRKPRPGLVERAAADLNFDPRTAYIVGDKESDIELGIATRATPVLVRTGYGAEVKPAFQNGVIVADNLVDAARQIIADQGRRQSLSQ